MNKATLNVCVRRSNTDILDVISQASECLSATLSKDPARAASIRLRTASRHRRTNTEVYTRNCRSPLLTYRSCQNEDSGPVKGVNETAMLSTKSDMFEDEVTCNPAELYAPRIRASRQPARCATPVKRRGYFSTCVSPVPDDVKKATSFIAQYRPGSCEPKDLEVRPEVRGYRKQPSATSRTSSPMRNFGAANNITRTMSTDCQSQLDITASPPKIIASPQKRRGKISVLSREFKIGKSVISNVEEKDARGIINEVESWIKNI